jgi:cleavage stimulation factor subunit 3
MADTPDDAGYEAYHPDQPSIGIRNAGDNFAGADDESDDYDPSNFVAAASEPTSAIAPSTVDPLEPTVERVKSSASGSEPSAKEQKSALLVTSGTVKLPRTVGGFVVDEDDDEEEGETSGLNGSLGTTSSPKAAQAADNTFSTSELPIEKATQDAGLAAPLTVSSAVALPLSTSHRSSLASNASASGTPLNFSAESSFPLPKTRLPQDKVGILEDRIMEDPRGDIDAWLSLISEHRSRNKLDDARAVYERFFKVFPSAVSPHNLDFVFLRLTIQAEQWIAYANMELENDEFYRMEQIFTRSLPSIPNVQLWSLYLNYIRRRNNLTMDTTGNARQIITQAYEFVLANIGIDKDSGFIWQEYLKFLKSGPGTVGGTTWQDGQKMDTLRKKYQAAVRIPTQSIQSLWTEYSLFENSLNKVTVSSDLNLRHHAHIWLTFGLGSTNAQPEHSKLHDSKASLRRAQYHHKQT